MSKKYTLLLFFNFVLGFCAIILYLPYSLSAFNLKGFDWLNVAPDLLKSNYFNTLIYFGIFLLVWFICINAFSLLTHPNLPKTLFKLTSIISLILPLVYVLALKYNWALEFWIKNISKNVKMISYISLCVSWGTWLLALVFNFTKRHKANINHILQALIMCALLTLIVAVNGWCGWSISNPLKIYGVLMGLFAVYLPISAIIMFIGRHSRA